MARSKARPACRKSAAPDAQQAPLGGRFCPVKLFSENRCQKKGLAYNFAQMVGINRLDVKKIDHFIPPRSAQSNGSLKLP